MNRMICVVKENELLTILDLQRKQTSHLQFKLVLLIER